MKNSAAVEKLDAHIKGLGMSRCGWAKEHGYPLPVITRFLKGERAVSFGTIVKLIGDTGGALCWQDFNPPPDSESMSEGHGIAPQDSAP